MIFLKMIIIINAKREKIFIKIIKKFIIMINYTYNNLRKYTCIIHYALRIHSFIENKELV